MPSLAGHFQPTVHRLLLQLFTITTSIITFIVEQEKEKQDQEQEQDEQEQEEDENERVACN